MTVTELAHEYMLRAQIICINVQPPTLTEEQYDYLYTKLPSMQRSPSHEQR